MNKSINDSAPVGARAGRRARSAKRAAVVALSALSTGCNLSIPWGEVGGGESDVTPEQEEAGAPLPDAAPTTSVPEGGPSPTLIDGGHDAGVHDASPGETGASADAGVGCTASPSTDPHNCGACGHDCAGGACSEGRCQPLTIATEGDIASVRVVGNEVLWGSQALGHVGCANLDGGAVGVFAASPNNGAFAIAGSDSTIAWITDDGMGGTDVWVNAEGGAGLSNPYMLSTTFAGAAAAAGGVTYFSDSIEEQIVVIDAAGGTTSFAMNLSGVQAGIGIGAGGAVYWTSDPGGDGGTVTRQADIHSDATTLATNLSSPGSLVARDDSVYWVERVAKTGAVLRIDGASSASLGTPTPVATGQDDPWDIAVDTTNVYWTNSGAGTVVSCARGTTCATPKVIASGLNAPTWLDVANGVVYFSDGTGRVALVVP